ncbi:MAG: hypothetical protein VX335_04560 [Pseudomonadota bacterium]|nr:hypothetical protein [Pseudomonadota bacterium]
MKLHDILGYTAFGLIFMWLMGWSILGALVSWQFGISITSYIAIPSAVSLPLFIVTLFLLIFAAGFAKYLDNKNGHAISKPIHHPENGTDQIIPQSDNNKNIINQSHINRSQNKKEIDDIDGLELKSTVVVD